MNRLFVFTSIVLLSFSQVLKAQNIFTVAGTGTGGYTGDGSTAIGADLDLDARASTGIFSSSLAFDRAGNIYIADNGNNVVRKVNTSGTISTIAGTGPLTGSYNGDNIAATAAELNYPVAVAADNAGNVYIADYANGRIRKVNAAGIITTYAGTGGCTVYTGDGGQATAACIGLPISLAIDTAGNLYFSDEIGSAVRKINTSGIISTVAGTGATGYNGDNIQATAASLWQPDGIAFDRAGNIYIADMNDNRVRKINATGTIFTVAGNGNMTYAGDSVSATTTAVNAPTGIALDTFGNLYIAEADYRIRKVDTGNIITTFAGTGVTGYFGDDIPAVEAVLGYVGGIATSPRGDLFVDDMTNDRIREITIGTVGVGAVINKGLEIKVYPNPCGGHFSFVALSDADEQMRVTISDIMGETVKEFATSTNKINDIDLGEAPGLYFISAQTAQSNYVSKLLVR